MTPVVRNILLACVAVFLLQQYAPDQMAVYFALWPLGSSGDTPPFQIWQLLSYAFLHGSWLHLFMNMFGLYMFGPEIERLLGSRRFMVYYLVCAVSSALAQLAVQALGAPAAQVVGASGAIFGILLAYALAYPKRRLILIPIPIPMPAWLFVTLYGLVELYLGVSGRQAGVAHFAHLGGMVGGFALILYWRSRLGARR